MFIYHKKSTSLVKTTALAKINFHKQKNQSTMIKLVSQIILNIWGWKINGVFPKNSPKFLLIVAPHHEGFLDVLLGWCVRNIQPLPNSRFAAKAELFVFPWYHLHKYPIAWLLLRLGAIPIDRKGELGIRPEGAQGKGFYVQQMVQAIGSTDQISITIVPEGTRTKYKTVSWKLGFYKIAVETGIPVICVGFDYKNKIVKIAPRMMMTGDWGKDRQRIIEWYIANIPGYTPEIPEELRWCNQKPEVYPSAFAV